MTGLRPHPLLSSLAVIALVAGAVLFVITLRSIPERQRHLKQKVETLARLQELSGGLVDDQAAAAVFAALPEHRPISLAALAEREIPGVRPAVRQRDVQPLADGWRARHMDVSFEQVPLADLSRFVMSAERQRPPWRLTRCTLNASETAPGPGRVTLQFTGIEKP
jgi:hypothetical protein